MIEAIGWRQLDTYFSTCATTAQTRRAHGTAGHHHRRLQLRAREGSRRLHQAHDLPGRIPAFARGDRPLELLGERPAGRRPRGHRSSLRRDAWRDGEPISPRTRPRCESSAWARSSRGCGTCTCATARRRSSSVTSATCNSCSRGASGALTWDRACRAEPTTVATPPPPGTTATPRRVTTASASSNVVVAIAVVGEDRRRGAPVSPRHRPAAGASMIVGRVRPSTRGDASPGRRRPSRGRPRCDARPPRPARFGRGGGPGSG